MKTKNHFKIIESEKGFHVNLVSANNRVVSTSALNGISLLDCQNIVELTQNVADARGNYKIKEGRDNQHYFNLYHYKMGENFVLFRSEGYTERHGALRAVKRMMKIGITKEVVIKFLNQ